MIIGKEIPKLSWLVFLDEENVYPCFYDEFTFTSNYVFYLDELPHAKVIQSQ